MNMSGGWQDYLHFTIIGEHVLLPGLELTTAWHFILASLLTVIICLSERLLTYCLSCSEPSRTHRPPQSPLRLALWRTVLYWLVTFDRMLYMLVAMTFNIPLLVILVTSLSFGQFIIEYRNIGSSSHSPDPESKEPLLAADYDERSSDRTAYPPSSTRPRSKSKPESIFIHPSESNIARADAAAMSMGLAGDTERVKGNVYPEDGESWELGRGPDIARELLRRD